MVNSALPKGRSCSSHLEELFLYSFDDRAGLQIPLCLGGTSDVHSLQISTDIIVSTEPSWLARVGMQTIVSLATPGAINMPSDGCGHSQHHSDRSGAFRL